MFSNVPDVCSLSRVVSGNCATTRTTSRVEQMAGTHLCLCGWSVERLNPHVCTLNANGVMNTVSGADDLPHASNQKHFTIMMVCKLYIVVSIAVSNIAFRFVCVIVECVCVAVHNVRLHLAANTPCGLFSLAKCCIYIVSFSMLAHNEHIQNGRIKTTINCAASAARNRVTMCPMCPLFCRTRINVPASSRLGY